MTGKHGWTPEPWQVTDAADHEFGWIDRKGDEDGAGDIATTWATNGGDAHDDARRIVACVNALAGIPTPELEAGIVGKMVEAMKGLLRLHEAHHNAPEHAAARALLARLGRAP